MAANLHKTLLVSVADKAARLREVRKELLRQQPGSTRRWFQGPQGCDIFLWYDDQRDLTQVQVTVEGRVVEWTPEYGTKTGRLRSFDLADPLSDRARLVFDGRTDAETLQLLAVLLDHATMDDLTRALLKRTLAL
jgi:hypothetical protein